MKKQFKTSLFVISIILFAAICTNSCKKKAKGTDKELYDMAKETNGFVWFKNTDALLSKSAGSGHDFALLRTRYNSIAAGKLDGNGKIIVGSIFPEGSLIVKELYSNSSKLGRYAILYKQSSNQYADAKGWVWGYINADGTVSISSDKKGSSCINCHSQTSNIDYMLMNNFFP